ncbi:MAG: LCP family protein [Christensenellaceae bacterium]|nr:LCP family protein [Christensenellaceae bacterium]
MRKWIKALTWVLVALIVLCGGMLGWMYSIYKNIKEDPTSAFGKNPGSGGIVSLDEGDHQQTEGVVNILLLGIDSNEEREAKNKGYRSDTIILLSLDMNNNKMNMISIPRDTRVEMNKLDRKTGEVTERTTNKINAAYAFGGGPKYYGAQNAVDCVEDFLSCDGMFDIHIDYYASIDLEGLPKLASSLGGVEVVLDRDLKGIGKEGETVTIDESNIDDYLRNRKTGGGDDGRAERQQDFIIAMVKKIQKLGAVKSATRLFNEALTYIRTDMGIDQILALAEFADGFDIDSIQRYRVTGEGQYFGSTWYYVADTQGLKEFILEEFYDPLA